MQNITRDLINLQGLIEGLNHLLNDAPPVTGPAGNAIYALSAVIDERMEELIKKIDEAERKAAA